MKKSRALTFLSSNAIHPGIKYILMGNDLNLAKVALYLTTFADPVIYHLTPERIAKDTSLTVEEAAEKLQLLMDFQLIVHVPYDEKYDIADYYLVNPDFLGPSPFFECSMHQYLCKQFDAIVANPNITTDELMEITIFDAEHKNM